MGKSLDIVKAPKQKPVTPSTVTDNTRDRQPSEFFEGNQQEEKSDPMIFYLIIGLCAIVLMVVLTVVLIYRNTRPSSNEQAATTTDNSTPQETTATTETDKTVTDTATPATTDSAATSQATAPTPTPVDKASVKIRIVNGNGRNGEASLMAQALKADGFTQITTGNALSRYKTTVVYYNTGKLAEAQAVEAIIKAKYKTSLLENPSITKTNDVLVALGNE